MIELIGSYFNNIYLLIVAILLFLSWYYFYRSQYDERRKKRNGIKSLKRNLTSFQRRFKNEHYDLFFRQNGLDSWLTSERLNIVRFSSLIIVFAIVIYGLANQTSYLNNTALLIFGGLPIWLIPKRPFPLYYAIIAFHKRRRDDISNEIYQLYNDLKAVYQLKNEAKSTYHLIIESLPYYTVIRPSMEKMLPLLEIRKNEQAWELFYELLGTKEAKNLGLVMKEAESIRSEQAFLLLEQKRNEFSNDLYNRYTEILKKRKMIIYVLVFAGALMVFLNEITIFYSWYKEIMSVVNQVV